MTRGGYVRRSGLCRSPLLAQFSCRLNQARKIESSAIMTLSLWERMAKGQVRVRKIASPSLICVCDSANVFVRQFPMRAVHERAHFPSINKKNFATSVSQPCGTLALTPSLSQRERVTRSGG